MKKLMPGMEKYPSRDTHAGDGRSMGKRAKKTVKGSNVPISAVYASPSRRVMPRMEALYAAPVKGRNPAGKKVCPGCGLTMTAAVEVCPRCGTAVPPSPGTAELSDK